MNTDMNDHALYKCGSGINKIISLIASPHVLELVEIFLRGQINRVKNDSPALIVILCFGVVNIHVVCVLVWSDVRYPVNGYHVAGFGSEERRNAEATDVRDGVMAHDVSNVFEYDLRRGGNLVTVFMYYKMCGLHCILPAHTGNP